jgi:hypothetical protein
LAIVKEVTISVNGNSAKLNKSVYLYLGDGQTTLLITLKEYQATIGNFEDIERNIVVQQETVYAQICLLKANNELVYSDKCEIIDDKIKFVISKDFIDEIGEKGTHLLQIHLYDGEGEDANRLTIPPVSLTILQPICLGGDGGNTPS